jgi:hypothetical protein
MKAAKVLLLVATPPSVAALSAGLAELARRKLESMLPPAADAPVFAESNPDRIVQYLDYQDGNFHFSADEQGPRPTLHYQHNSIVVPVLAFDVCEYHGSRPDYLMGEPIEIRNKDGVAFTPMIFAPAWFWLPYGEALHELCVAWVVRCPVRAGTWEHAQYCQESRCVADKYLPGYMLLNETKAGMHIDGAADASHVTMRDPTRGNRVVYSSGSRERWPAAEIDDVHLVSYHTHATYVEAGRDSTISEFMQFSNPEVGQRVKVGPANVNVDEEWMREQLGHELVARELHNCHKITTESGAAGVYIQNIAPWSYYGEENGGVPIVAPRISPSTANYTRLIETLRRYTPEEFDTIYDYRPGTTINGKGDRRVTNTHLEVVAMCLLRNDFALACYADRGVMLEAPKVFQRFWNLTAIIALTYPFLFATQRLVWKDGLKRFKRKQQLWLALRLHVTCGGTLLFLGAIFVLCNACGTITFGDIVANKGWLEPMYILCGVCGVVHTLTAYRMLEEVQGDRRLTIPLYIVAATLNLYNAIQLLAKYNLHELRPTESGGLMDQEEAYSTLATYRMLLLWSSLSTFVYVRAHLVLMIFFHISYPVAYTYAILGSATITYPLSGQTPWAFMGLALFFVYAPLHRKINRLFSWGRCSKCSKRSKCGKRGKCGKCGKRGKRGKRGKCSFRIRATPPQDQPPLLLGQVQ